MVATTGSTSKKSSKAKKSTVKKPVVKKAPVKFVPPEVEEGTWQDTIVKSAILKERAHKGDVKAGELLWSGAQQGINDWLPNSDDDASAEGLYQELLSLMGKSRKGDASKIAKVAVAVKDKGLTLSSFTSLSRAYGAARDLIDSAPLHDAEDNAAEELAEAIGAAAPKSTSSVDGAAKILLAAGVDEASRAIVAAVIDAAGSYDKAEPVLRSLARSLSQEIAGTKPKPEPKAKATPTPKGDTVKKATAKPASEKAKAKPKAKPKPAPVEEIEDDEPNDIDDSTEVEYESDEDFASEDEAIANGLDSDLDDLLDDEVNEDTEVETPEVPVKTKAKPVVRRR